MARGISDRLTRTRIFDSHKVNRIAQKKNVKSQCIHYIPLCVGSLKGLVIGLIGLVPPHLRIAFDKLSSGSEYPIARLRFGFIIASELFTNYLSSLCKMHVPNVRHVKPSKDPLRQVE